MLRENVWYEVIYDRLWIASNIHEDYAKGNFEFLKTDDEIQYRALCDDFGPVNIENIIRFIEILEALFWKTPVRKIVYSVCGGPRNMANAGAKKKPIPYLFRYCKTYSSCLFSFPPWGIHAAEIEILNQQDTRHI